MDFKTLKKSAKDFSSLSKKIEEINNPKSSYGDEDENFWQPEVDKSGNGYAVIRFLPQPAADGDEGTPFVHYFRHAFQGPEGDWYIENDLTTLGKKDPCTDYNNVLWKKGHEDQARKQKRKLYYVSNILVIEDPANPENEGKIFYYRYGKKIFEKIEAAMHPKFKDQEGYNPFDLWEGANFSLRIMKKDGFRNYDESSFAPRSEVGESDADRERIWKAERTLLKFTNPDRFKSYEDLQERLETVLGIDLEAILNKKKERATTVSEVAKKPEPRTVEDDDAEEAVHEMDEDEDDSGDLDSQVEAILKGK